MIRYWNAFFFSFTWGMCLAHSIPGYGHSPGGPSLWGYFSPPLIHRVPSPTNQSPMEVMVDLTNNLAVSILQDHSYSRGNFAFSPYGVASVLVVLYEGARGESARQIHTAVGFPPDRGVIRVGFRDIHRHLQSYFSHEGYLSGISLNKNQSNLKQEYKNILKFYGYEIDHLSEGGDGGVQSSPTESVQPSETTVHEPGTTVPTVASTVSVTSSDQPDKKVTKPDVEATETTVQTSTIETVSQYTTEEPMKTITTASEVTSSSVAGTVEPATLPEPAQTEASTLSTTSSAITEGTVKPTTVTEPNSKKTENATLLTTTESQGDKMTTASIEHPNCVDEVDISLTLEENSTVEDGMLKINETKEESLKNKKEKATENEKQTNIGTNEKNSNVTEENFGTGENSTDSHTENNSFAENVTQESGTQETKTEETNTDIDNGMLIPQFENSETTSHEMTSTTTEMDESLPVTTETITSTSRGREKKSESSSIQMRINIDNCENGEKEVSNRIRGIVNSKVGKWLHGNAKKPNGRVKRTLTDYLKSPYSVDLSLQLQNGMFDTHVSRNSELYRNLPRMLFLVDGAVDTPVPMMTYTNVFPYAYIPRLHAKALEFPLDDVRYKLLILLPVERRGLRQLIYDLSEFPLNNVLAALRPTRVKTMVPTFMVEGFVILTSSLQKLGIWDVFDPRKANLSGMSQDPELYVRNVEQSVTVVIRNYVEILDIQTRTMAARQMEQDFEATQPFLYFVLDTATNVALMAGQILDPLNSRIY